TIGENANIHPTATVEAGAIVGRRTVVYPGVYVGREAVVGDDCLLYPNVVIYDRCRLGDRVTLHANTVIGQDGFGYATHEGVHHKIPQTGIVVIEDDVEMGAGCAIERAAMGETRVGRGTKFADLISIGHGTTIGQHCLLVSLVGVSGSVEMGNYVVLGGQAGVTGHLKIGDGVQAAGKAAIVQDVPAGMKVAGIPALELQLAKRNALAGAGLADLFKRVRRLEREQDRRDDR
ncbi:MAG: UDP-3-O-(3-hydroxymyristoyl)glucosamine N-acyltransferase, partial [Planctomycetota bacterium]